MVYIFAFSFHFNLTFVSFVVAVCVSWLLFLLSPMLLLLMWLLLLFCSVLHGCNPYEAYGGLFRYVCVALPPMWTIKCSIIIIRCVAITETNVTSPIITNSHRPLFIILFLLLLLLLGVCFIYWSEFAEQCSLSFFHFCFFFFFILFSFDFALWQDTMSDQSDVCVRMYCRICVRACATSPDITILGFDSNYSRSLISFSVLFFSISPPTAVRFIRDQHTHHRPVASNISPIQVHRMNCKCGRPVDHWHQTAMIMEVRKVASLALVDCPDSNDWHRPVCIIRLRHDQLHHTMDLT